jgi:hypothetical protein
MPAGWLDAHRESSSSVEVADEYHDQRPTPKQDAYLYVRQSTVAQVRHHRESTERQYALSEKAQQLGWSIRQFRFWTGIWARQEHRNGLTFIYMPHAA